MTSKCLLPEQTARFYHIWFPLLHYVNEQRHLVSSFLAQPADGTVMHSDAATLRNALWADDLLREQFIAENPAHLSPADLELVASWQYRVAGSFVVLRALKAYTVFLSGKEPIRAYGVIGLASPIEETVPFPLPVYVDAVLLPFEGQIIYDSLMVSYPVSFGAGMRSGFNDSYRDAQERDGIITSLLPADPTRIDEQRAQVKARATKTLQAFRKYLVQSGLSQKMVDQHAGTIEAFAETMLLSEVPPRGLLDTRLSDVQAYLHVAGPKTSATSFKRFARFLEETGRMEYEQTKALRDMLKEL
jgi:hypothetical protein